MEIIQKAIAILRNGGTIAYNTDTVPGLGCDATNEAAVEQIFELKQRPQQKSLILLVANDGMLQRFVKEVPEVAWDIVDVAEKPTTIIYPNGKNLPNNVLAADGSIGIRMVKSGPLHQLIHKFGKPVVSTSANISGEKNPSTLSEISQEIISKVDLVVDLPTDTTKQASSIIKIELNGEFKIIRK